MPQHLEATTQIVNPAALARCDIGLWAELMANDPELGTPFLSHTYVATAGQVFYGVRVCRLMVAGRVVGFFPFQFRSPIHQLFGIAEPIGANFTDHFGIVAAPELALTPRMLMRLAGLNALLFTHLHENQSRFGLTGDRAEPGFRIRLSGSAGPAGEQIGDGNNKLISDTDRRARKLVAAHGPLRFVFDHANAMPHLHDLITAKRAQYARTNHRDVLATDKSRRFLALLKGSRDPACRGVLSTLHAGDTWVASHFGLMHRGALHYWFPVYNPDLTAFSPGRQLLVAIIRSAGDTGVAWIDRGSGDSPSKRAFATERHQFQRGFWYRPHITSLLYRAGLSVAWRTKGTLVRLKGRAEPSKIQPASDIVDDPQSPRDRNS